MAAPLLVALLEFARLFRADGARGFTYYFQFSGRLSGWMRAPARLGEWRRGWDGGRRKI